ncbi:hypothetical protein BC940DRAFT_227567, partial [Gongronella butleri]
ELNPIEQFWPIVKSKVRRDELKNNELLSHRVKAACNNVSINDLRAFIGHSAARINDCFSRTPM